jgi:hypothetical protein
MPIGLAPQKSAIAALAMTASGQKHSFAAS